jgi:hypothetical protein
MRRCLTRLTPSPYRTRRKPSALDLFDAFGSKQKTLHANLGGHTGVPQFEADDGGRFFARRLK